MPPGDGVFTLMCDVRPDELKEEFLNENRDSNLLG